MSELSLDLDVIRAIRRALIVGLSSYGEIERLTNQVGVPEEWIPTHPTGSPDTVGEFANAFAYLDHLETELREAEPCPA
jgi:hypothetical protein